MLNRIQPSGRADAEAKERLHAIYKQFISAKSPNIQAEAGKNLIRAIFGKEPIGEDSAQ